MLELTRNDRGVAVLHSPLLAPSGVIHGFSTRFGGVSPPPFDTLNLGSLAKSTSGDERADANANVAENFRRFRAAIGAGKRARVTAKQVHGAEVWSPPTGPVRPDDAPEADAMVSSEAGHLLTIRTADCLAVLLATSDGEHVAAAHAGWRGLIAGVLEKTVEALAERSGAEPQELLAAIGPGVGVERYEVGPEVANAFHEAGLVSAVRLDFGTRPHVDLRAAAILQLTAAGLRPDRIDTTDRCTFDDADLFFSYRRDGPTSGRLAAAIGATA
jgi:YfiH family protein